MRLRVVVRDAPIMELAIRAAMMDPARPFAPRPEASAVEFGASRTLPLWPANPNPKGDVP